MKIILVIAALMALAAAKPQSGKDATILAYSNDVGLQGYNFAYKTSDKTEHQESAELRNAGTENEAIAVRGSFTWVAADGQTYTVTYVADENGFQPQGAHLPGSGR